MKPQTFGVAVLGLALLLTLCGTVAAQFPAELRGRVTDQLGGAPVVGARVEVPAAGRVATTGAAGEFVLRGLPPGTHEFRVAAPGYETWTETVQVENGRSVWVPVELLPEPLLLQELTARAAASEAGAVVLNRETIRASGARELAELLQDRAGVVVVRRGGPGAPAVASIRGSSADQVLVLVDGIPLNSLLTGEADLSTIALQGVERVTLLRGARAARYGGGALAGVILVETRRPPPRELEMNLAAGSWGERTAALSSGGRARLGGGTVGGIIAGEWRDADGGFRYAVPIVRGGGEGQRANADVSSLNLLAAAVVEHGSTEVRARIAALQLERGMPGSIVHPSFTARQDQQNLSGAVTARGQAAELGWSLGLDAQRQHASYRDSTPPFGAPYHNRAEVAGIGANGSVAATFGPVAMSAGAETQQLRFAADGLAADAPEAQQRTGAWADARAVLDRGEWAADAFAALRLDRHSLLREPVWSPRLGLSVEHGRVALRLSGGSAFAPPSLADQFFQQGFRVRPNPNLEPERVRAEVEVEATLRDQPLGPALLDAQWAAFRADVDGMIVWYPDFRFVWQPRNFDVRRRGWDAGARARLAGAEIRGALNHVTVEYAQDAARGQVVYRPVWSGSAAARWARGGLHGEVAGRYTGTRRTVAGSSVNALPGFWLADARVGREIVRGPWRAEAALAVENLLDREAAFLVDYPYPGRSWRVQLRVRFDPRRPDRAGIPFNP